MIVCHRCNSMKLWVTKVLENRRSDGILPKERTRATNQIQKFGGMTRPGITARIRTHCVLNERQ
jgi:hypothetical protein